MADLAARQPLAAIEPNTMSSTLVLKPNTKRPRDVKVQQDVAAISKPEAFFFPSRSFLPKSEEAESELIPCAYADLVEELDNIPADYSTQIEKLRDRHDTAATMLSNLQTAAQSKNKRLRITSQKLDALLQMKMLYDYIIAITTSLPVEEDSQDESDLKENPVVQELVCILSRVKVAKVSAASRAKAKKKSLLVDDEAEEEEEPAGPRKKRKCNEGKKGVNADGSEAEDEDEDDDDEKAKGEKAAFKIQQQQIKTFDALKQDSMKQILVDQSGIDSMEAQAKGQEVDHLVIHASELSLSETSLLALLYPKLKSLPIIMTDRRTEEPAPAILMELQLQSIATQLAFSTPNLHLTRSEVLAISQQATAIKTRAADAAACIKTPDPETPPNTIIEYAHSAHSSQAIQGLKQLIGTIGMLDDVIDSKGYVVKDIVPWLSHQINEHYQSSNFKVHPLADLRIINTIIGVAPSALRSKGHATVITSIRKALVELATNVAKAVTLLAGFGLGVTSSALWSTLCRPGSALLRSTSSDWHLTTLLSLLLEYQTASTIALSPLFMSLVEQSPVSSSAIEKWNQRMESTFRTRDIAARGTLAFLAKTILSESEENGNIVYKVAMSSPNIILQTSAIPPKSKLLVEWAKRSAGEKKRFAEFEESLREKDEDNSGSEEEDE